MSYVVLILPYDFCVYWLLSCVTGLKAGLPCVEAPCNIVIVVAPATGAEGAGLDCCGALVSRGLLIDVTVPVPSRLPDFCCMDDATGGFLAILCQFGIAYRCANCHNNHYYGNTLRHAFASGSNDVVLVFCSHSILHLLQMDPSCPHAYH